MGLIWNCLPAQSLHGRLTSDMSIAGAHKLAELVLPMFEQSIVLTLPGAQLAIRSNMKDFDGIRLDLSVHGLSIS